MKLPFLKEKKEHPGASALMVSNLFTSQITKSDEYVKEGYTQNAVVYRAVQEITTAASLIDIEMWQDGKIIDLNAGLNNDTKSIYKLLNRPNPMTGCDGFIKNIFTDWLLTGEMFISISKNKTELWPLSPLKMEVIAGKSGIPKEYIHGSGKDKVVFPVKQIDGDSDVFHHKFYNPLNYWRGLAPLSAGAIAADANNEGLRWNYSLLKNSGRPSGLIQFEGSPDDLTIERLTEYFKRRFQGAANAGQIPMLEGGAKWQQMDNSPRDMDFIKTMDKTDLYIAMVFGVPLPLISNDASTFNNLEQAKERLYTDTVLPLFNEFLDSFSLWLSKKFNLETGILLKANQDSIPALESIRQKKYERAIKMVNSGVLTRDEARELIGYEPKGGMADELFVPSNNVPLGMGYEDTQPDKQ